MGIVIRSERLQFVLTKKEIAMIDDWRFTKRMPSRASAIRELLRRGLAAEGIKTTGTVGDSND
jgi:Arc/MetJ-type ribon-helix-helix transcriptional regulator